MTKKTFLSSILFLSGFLTSIVFSANIDTQNFQDGFIPQTTVDKEISQCKNTINFAFYDKQKIKFTSELAGNHINDIWRILNTNQDTNWQNHQAWAPDSTKIYIYNPYWLLSTTDSISNPNSFLSDFLFVSNIKPSWVNKVYVWYQSNFTHILWWSDTTLEDLKSKNRWKLAWQIVYEHWIRQPSKVKNNWQTTYTYTIPTINWFEQKTIKLDLEFSKKYPRVTHWNACTNIFVAKCGDGVIDNPDKSGWNSTDWKQWIQTNKGFVKRRKDDFIGEICDDWEDNWKPGKCNLTCDGYVNLANERCGDEILQPAWTYYNGDPDTMSFEECDDGDEESDTDWITNGDDPELHFCSSICLPTFTEAFVEVFINA